MPSSLSRLSSNSSSYGQGAVAIQETVTSVREDVVSDSCTETAYLTIADEELRHSIISEWEVAMSTARLSELVCAVCGRRTAPEHVTLVKPARVDLSKLRNDGLPAKLLPMSYNLQAYEGAILHPKGLTNVSIRADLRICCDCLRELNDNRLPKFALANWLYYAHERLPVEVQRAFRESTQVERILVSRARASTISFRFSDMKGHALYGTRPEASQRFVKGNVAIHPQDAPHLSEVLPPGNDVLRDTICAVFVGEHKPTKENIEKLGPVLVRKSRVKTMIDFLVSENPMYALSESFRGFSQENLDGLFGEGTQHQNEGVPCSIEIGHIQLSDAVAGATEGYIPGENDGPASDDHDILMETVGYTDGDDSPVSTREMALKALSHCLRKGRFVQSQAGSRFVPDFENEQLLSWLFPHLDPWGIGGFHSKRRLVPLTLDEQLKYLLTIDDPLFRDDPNFAFIYFNIRQKRMVVQSVSFRVPASQRDDVIRKLMAVDINVLDRLIDKFKSNPRYKPENADERGILQLLMRVNTVSHDLPGSNGYKIALRNQIRALINHIGTPTLFITLNPSDRDHPLVRLYAGEEIDIEDSMRGIELSRWQRTVLAARNPSACARFFDTMIRNFINIVLRFGRSSRGLFG
ncbi:hypothetical protein OH77DRAFT_1395929, partial [Trametes cingulata]